MAFVERKLFTLNTGHAIPRTSEKWPVIRPFVTLFSTKNPRGGKRCDGRKWCSIDQAYGFDADKHAAYIRKILGRFETRT